MKMAFLHRSPLLLCKQLAAISPRRNLITTISPSRPTIIHHGSTLSLRTPPGGGRTISSSSSPSSPKPPTQPNPAPQSAAPQSGTANAPTRLFHPSSLADDATVKAANEDILRFAAQNITNPQYQAFLRQFGLDWPLAWLQTNFPPASQNNINGFVYLQLGSFPQDISYVDKTEKKEEEGDDGKTSTVVKIPQDDTRLVLVGKRQGDGDTPAARIDGIKQSGVVCVALCVLPPAGAGKPEVLAGTPLADMAGTPAMEAAEQALLGFIRGLQDVGYQGARPMGEDLDGCQAIVFMGQDLLISEYSREKGFFDPPGGVVFEKKKVPLGWPFLEESEQK